jgi:hypothetical protein
MTDDEEKKKEHLADLKFKELTQTRILKELSLFLKSGYLNHTGWKMRNASYLGLEDGVQSLEKVLQRRMFDTA